MNYKKVITYLIATVLFLSISSIYVSAGLVDKEVYPRPAQPPVFGSDHKAVDSTFNSVIMRVTGPVGSNAVYESNSETQNLAPIQHFINPWSYTGNHFLVWMDRLSQGAGARVDLFEINRVDFTVTRVRTVAAPVSKMNYNRGIFFDHNNEWILYAVDTSTSLHSVRRWNLNETEAQEGLASNSNEILITDPEGIDQLTISRDDNRFCYYTNNKKVKVWERTSNTIYVFDCNDWYSFDESQLSDDGKYVFVKGKKVQNTMIGANCYSYDFTQLWEYGYLGPDYFAGKHSGYQNKWVNESSESGYRLVVRNLDTDKPGKNPWEDTPKWIYMDPNNNYNSGTVHPSYSNSNYIYGGFFRSTGHPSPWVPYHDEICRFKDDGTEVLRLCHAWSNFYSNSFDELPCYASAGGDYVIFYSNWNAADADGRHDVFIVQVNANNAKTISVCENGCDSTTIQGGYNLADDGDTVEIQDSRTYTEYIQMNDDATQDNPIILRGKDGQNPKIQWLSYDWQNLVTISGDYNILKNVILGPLGDGNGVEITADHCIVEGCTFNDINTEYMFNGTQGEGIRIAGNYAIIRNNTFYDCAHGCIILQTINNGSVSYNQILNNKISNNYGHGISLLFNTATYNLVDGNVIHIGSLSAARYQKSPFQLSGCSHNSIRRNVIYDIYTRGVELSTYGGAGNTAIDNWFYNNTFYNITTRPDETGNNAWIEIGVGYGGINTVTGNKFYNNIADRVGQQTTAEYCLNHIRGCWILGYFFENDAGNNEAELIANNWNGNILKNNCIRVYHDGSYDLNNSQAIFYMYRDGGGACGVLSYSVTGANGLGSMSGNITDEPLFLSTDTSQANWWRLQKDSPLIDAGIEVNDPNASIGGWSQLTYNGDAPDIGAHEYLTTIISGDINADGEVNVLDVQACVNVILGGDVPQEIADKARQVAEPKDKCDVLDVQAVVNAVLGGG